MTIYLKHVLEKVCEELQTKEYKVVRVEYDIANRTANIEIIEKNSGDFHKLRKEGYNPVSRAVPRGSDAVIITCSINLTKQQEIQNGSTHSKTKTKNTSESIRNPAKGGETGQISGERQNQGKKSTSIDKHRPRCNAEKQKKDKKTSDKDAIRDRSEYPTGSEESSKETLQKGK